MMSENCLSIKHSPYLRNSVICVVLITCIGDLISRNTFQVIEVV